MCKQRRDLEGYIYLVFFAFSKRFPDAWCIIHFMQKSPNIS